MSINSFIVITKPRKISPSKIIFTSHLLAFIKFIVKFLGNYTSCLLNMCCQSWLSLQSTTEAKIHWNKQFSCDNFVALKCLSRSGECDCQRSHHMFCDGKTVSSVTGKWMLAASVQICRLQLDSPLNFYWTQCSFRCFFRRKRLLRTVVVSED